MIGIGAAATAARRHARWFVRDLFPNRPVVREVQGVRMVLPWSHRLPDYAPDGSPYGQNLVRLAALLAESAPPLTVLDVGANVGDSALQILHAADGQVLCVEADKAYLDFLRRNVGDDPRITVVEGLLVVDDDASAGSTAVRTGGTTRFVEGGGSDAMPTVSAAALRARYPSYDDLRLVKSDTDGYDVDLVPAIAEAWSDRRPVLFLEYDPHLTRLAGSDPLGLWPRLTALGYHHVAVWDNGGEPLGQTTTAQIADQAKALDALRPRRRKRVYWDVAVVHADDAAGRQAIEALVPEALPV
ncbi:MULTISPECIES: FkbM family methyltransferase [Nocardioides]|uniref:FkbM family methyltransferase n=1 Tax=Nocardioides vastitatis TaxID=2568655 RepID=A0ABW0ZBU1_9ACTN|nr:FkbM family methyltransferase [Nocardioides sp.]THJ02338.1 FkbM family methyltransferase [Nocardioides sp.]